MPPCLSYHDTYKWKTFLVIDFINKFIDSNGVGENTIKFSGKRIRNTFEVHNKWQDKIY